MLERKDTGGGEDACFSLFSPHFGDQSCFQQRLIHLGLRAFGGVDCFVAFFCNLFRHHLFRYLVSVSIFRVAEVISFTLLSEWDLHSLDSSMNNHFFVYSGG